MGLLFAVKIVFLVTCQSIASRGEMIMGDVSFGENNIDCYTESESHLYNGETSMTVGGLTCQRWNSSSPHQHDFTDPANFPEDTVEEAQNFCRDPDGGGYPWCYTIDPNVRWQACNITICSAKGTIVPAIARCKV